MDPRSLYRREGDPPGSDFRHRRQYEEREVIIKRNSNAVAKVLIIIGSTVISVLLAATAFMIGRDRNVIDRDIADVRNIALQNSATTAAHTAQLVAIGVNQESFKLEIAGFKEEAARVRQLSEENQVMLRTLLARTAR